jgi:phage baseplate assembly protein V
MGDKPDIQRLIGDLVRFGTVASVDHAKATCRVRLEQILSGDVPWAGGRAGATRTWSPPSVGEQVVLICPEGDIAAGFIIPGVYSNARPAPAATEGSFSIHFDDGTWLGYDPGAKALTAIVGAGGTALIEAPGGITIRGDVTVEGKLTASDDVLAGDTSLRNHRHDKVQSGDAISGKPVA